MSIALKYRGDILDIIINQPRIDGKNEIFQALMDSDPEPLRGLLEINFDMARVEYVNSLGIAEFISIHRYFDSISNGKTRLCFRNVERKIARLFQMVELGGLSDITEK